MTRTPQKGINTIALGVLVGFALSELAHQMVPIIQKQRAWQVFVLKNGLTVEQLPAEVSDIEKMLNVSRWKLRVGVPPQCPMIRYDLSLYRYGKLECVYGGQAHSTNGKAAVDTSVALYPQGQGDSWTTAKTLYFWTSNSGRSSFPNPFVQGGKSSAGWGFSQVVNGLQVENEQIVLLSGNPSGQHYGDDGKENGGRVGPDKDGQNAVDLILTLHPIAQNGQPWHNTKSNRTHELR